jgi:hypothetical protein
MTAAQHAEWLSLLEISGPFLSLPVLTRVWPQGIDAFESERARLLRDAYEEWADNVQGLMPDPHIHDEWVHFVLETALDFDDEVLVGGAGIPENLSVQVLEHGETLRPDLVLMDPQSSSSQESRAPRMVIQILPPGQDLDKPLSGSRWKSSVATRMMELLHVLQVDHPQLTLGLLTNGERWMLVYAPKGETTGFISWYASLWFEERLTLRAFAALLGAVRFFGVQDDETLANLLATSAKDQHEVTDTLGYQVRRAVEILVQAIDRADHAAQGRLLAGLGATAENLLYEAALTVMMRLVFLLSAEERKLLPLDDPFYAENYAIYPLRGQLQTLADQTGEEVLDRRYDAWSRTLATFRAVYAGVQHDRLHIPAYGGSLFDPDRFPFLEGRAPDSDWRVDAAQPMPISNRTVLHLLDALQVLGMASPTGGRERRRISFRALDIEQIGHVYEGLLDHRAVRTPEPVLGLTGTKKLEPEIPLFELERFLDQNSQSTETQSLSENDALLDYLDEQTGRSRSALKNSLKQGPEKIDANKLRIACQNDTDLYQRVLPFAGVVRDDDFGTPVVIPANSVYVTEGTTRRSTGTHYTPRSLTEPIVQHTIEPLVYIGPAEGKPKEEWMLKTPEALLDLKICDMAMGSGAFLVQVVRYLSERLVESWELYGGESNKLSVDSEQTTADRSLNTDDLLIEARRLVTDRCIYGVDKNPLAVEMAKLSLWLITLDRAKPFSFLDHSLKCGDSLVGASENDFLRWARGLLNDPAHAASKTLFDETLQQQVALARQKRAELQSFQVLDVRDAERKAVLLAEAEAALERVKLGCDLLVGVKLLGLNQKEQEALSGRFLLDYLAGEAMEKPDAKGALKAARKERAFHWEFEFPEVFATEGIGGFSAFIGNPPFLKGSNISTEFGDGYFSFLRDYYSSSHGQVDLCAFFFLRSFEQLKIGGKTGLLATNTISQGDTRNAGLGYISQNNGEIFFAITSQSWPGSAAVFVSVVIFSKGKYSGEILLNGKNQNYISSYLDAAIEGNPYPLCANVDNAFRGMDVLGMGFTLSEEIAKQLIKEDPRNVEILFPFINGKDLYTNVDQSASRWVIYFHDWPLSRNGEGIWSNASKTQKSKWLAIGIVPKDYPGKVAEDYPECMEIVKKYVYPERQKNRNKKRREIWWRFDRPRIELYNTLKSVSRVLAIALTSKTAAVVFVPSIQVFSHATGVFTYTGYTSFSIMQSNFHFEWAWKYGSSLKGDLRYTPSSVFQTFPFPTENDNNIKELATIGEMYHEHRRQIMLTQQEGLTKTYNRFHNPEETSEDIAQLRELHIEMDQAVAAAYGWDDLQLDHDFHETPQGLRFTISEVARRDVLSGLLELNHQRYAEEVVAGLHDKKGKKSKGGRGQGSGKRKAAPKPKPEPKAHPTDQSSFLGMVNDTPAVAQTASDAVPGNQIGAWDQCICILCDKHLAGFQVAEHTKTVHDGKDPGYRMMGNK